MKKIMTKKNTPQPYRFVKQLMLTLPLLGLFLLSASNVSGQITTDVATCTAGGPGTATLMPAGMMNGKPVYSCIQCIGNGSVCDVTVSWNGTFWEYLVECSGTPNPGVVATNTADTCEPPCAANFPWTDVLLGCIDGNVTIAGADCGSAIDGPDCTEPACPVSLTPPADASFCDGASVPVAPTACSGTTNTAGNPASAISYGVYLYDDGAGGNEAPAGAFSTPIPAGSAFPAYTDGLMLTQVALLLGCDLDPPPNQTLNNTTCEPKVFTFAYLPFDLDIPAFVPDCEIVRFDYTVYPDPNNYTVTETPGDCDTAPTVSITAVNGDVCYTETGTLPTTPDCDEPDNTTTLDYSFDPSSFPADCSQMFSGSVTATCANDCPVIDFGGSPFIFGGGPACEGDDLSICVNTEEPAALDGDCTVTMNLMTTAGAINVSSAFSGSQICFDIPLPPNANDPCESYSFQVEDVTFTVVCASGACAAGTTGVIGLPGPDDVCDGTVAIVQGGRQVFPLFTENIVEPTCDGVAGMAQLLAGTTVCEEVVGTAGASNICPETNPTPATLSYNFGSFGSPCYPNPASGDISIDCPVVTCACMIQAEIVMTECDDQGNTDPFDDLITFTVAITDNGAGSATGWTDDQATQQSGTYGNAVTYTVLATNSVTVTYTDADDPDCTASITLTAYPCATSDQVPTVGEWGLIILGLLMLITAVVGIRQRREEEVIA